MLRLALVTALALHLGCSPSKSSHEDGQTAGATGASLQTLALQTVDELPACADGNKGQLVYIIGLQEFRVCGSGAWGVIDVKGKDGTDGVKGVDGKDGTNGLSVTSIWTYLDDSFIASENISESVDPIYIGDIRLVEFSDGTQFVTVNGKSLLAETSGDISHNDFAHSFFLAKGKTTESMKVWTFADSIAYYAAGTQNGNRTLAAAVDVDGDINNNVITTFILVKAFPSN